MASAAPSELPPVDSRKGSIFRPQHEPQAPIIGPTMHPSRASTKTPAQMLDEMMRSPFFVTPDAAASAAADPAANDELEAFRALRREGTPLELARSCRESGNELFKGKGWAGAKGFYTQGLDALRGKGVSEKEDGEEGEEDPKGSEEEKARLREVLLVNRAACDLELSRFPTTFILHAHLFSSH